MIKADPSTKHLGVPRQFQLVARKEGGEGLSNIGIGCHGDRTLARQHLVWRLGAE